VRISVTPVDARLPTSRQLYGDGAHGCSRQQHQRQLRHRKTERQAVHGEKDGHCPGNSRERPALGRPYLADRILLKLHLWESSSGIQDGARGWAVTPGGKIKRSRVVKLAGVRR